ncbi:MAG TPA: S8 family serine peptidase [Steroidobacteraceae bacterium]|nr:S8 family serine peptidase [Steroidobacteraceae bacterium]
MRRWAAAICAVLLAGGCSSAPVRIESKALPTPSLESTDRFIIAAIDNRPIGFTARAGSTPRGYDTIVPYGPSSSAQRLMRAVEAQYGLSEVSSWPIEPLHMHCAMLKIPDGADRQALLETLSHDPRIRLAQPLQSFATRTAYNDPYVELQRGFQQMNVGDAHPWSRGEGVRVAIIDTGVDTEHPDLAANIAAAENFVDSDTLKFRSDRHGTEVAGVIAAVANNHQGIVGVAPGARLLVFKACWQLRLDADAALCNSFTLARALVAALNAKAQVVNLSLAGPRDPLLSELIRVGLNRGMLFVGAAADDSQEGAQGLMQQSGIIEVASAERPVASALLAPGREILTLLPGGHYDFASGDSIATAEVTGVVALLLERDHELSATRAYQVLRDTSARPAEASASGPHVDACGAVTAVIGRGTCTHPALDQRLAEHAGHSAMH